MFKKVDFHNIHCKTGFYKFNRSDIFSLSSLYFQIKCDLVILNLRANNETNSNPDKQICAIKKNITTSDYNIQYNLIDLAPYNGCELINNSSISNNAILMRLNSSPSCSLETMLKNLELNKASLAIIGLNSSIVCFSSFCFVGSINFFYREPI